MEEWVTQRLQWKHHQTSKTSHCRSRCHCRQTTWCYRHTIWFSSRWTVTPFTDKIKIKSVTISLYIDSADVMIKSSDYHTSRQNMKCLRENVPSGCRRITPGSLYWDILWNDALCLTDVLIRRSSRCSRCGPVTASHYSLKIHKGIWDDVINSESILHASVRSSSVSKLFFSRCSLTAIMTGIKGRLNLYWSGIRFFHHCVGSKNYQKKLRNRVPEALNIM